MSPRDLVHAREISDALAAIYDRANARTREAQEQRRAEDQVRHEAMMAEIAALQMRCAAVGHVFGTLPAPMGGAWRCCIFCRIDEPQHEVPAGLAMKEGHVLQ